jgi:glycosyltransferase involved in cell wall biosynthesis
MEKYKKQEGGLRMINSLQGAKNKDGEQPLVSIVTVVRNMGDTIERAICSVINQTYSNIEYIVIDGASTDKTLEKIRKYEDGIQYWVSEPDEGISDAFNKGIRLSGGELIGIINGDDWYELDAVEHVVRAYLQDKSVGVIHGKMKLYENGEPLFVRACPINLDKLWVHMILNHPTCFVNKQSYDQYNLFDPRYKFTMDYELMLRFYIHGVTFFYIDSILANYSLGGESDLGEMRGWREGMAIHAKYGYSSHFCQHWFSLAIIVVKRIVRKLLGRDHPLLVLIRRFTKEQC